MNCHICNGFTKVYTYEKTDITYYHCEACEYIFKSPTCYQTIEAQKRRYDLHENNEEDEGYKAYFQRFLDFILPSITWKNFITESALLCSVITDT